MSIPIARARPSGVPLGAAAIAHRTPRLIGVLGVAGGALVAAGAMAPWLSLYAGLQPIAGTAGPNGRVLLALGVVTALVGARQALAPGAAARWLLGVLAFVVTALSIWLGTGLAATAAAMAAEPLLLARLEPGLLLSLLGGGTAFATLFAPLSASETPHDSTAVVRYAVGGSLLVAGAVHLVLAPEHAVDAAWLGGAFAIAGLVQIVLAAALLGGSVGRQRLLTIVGSSAVFVVAYALAVTVGLPAAQHGHAEPVAADHGHVESISEAGVTTVAAELVAAAGGLVLLARPLGRAARERPQHVSQAPARWWRSP